MQLVHIQKLTYLALSRISKSGKKRQRKASRRDRTRKTLELWWCMSTVLQIPSTLLPRDHDIDRVSESYLFTRVPAYNVNNSNKRRGGIQLLSAILSNIGKYADKRRSGTNFDNKYPFNIWRRHSPKTWWDSQCRSRSIRERILGTNFWSSNAVFTSRLCMSTNKISLIWCELKIAL